MKNYIAAITLGILISGCQDAGKANKKEETKDSKVENKAVLADKDKMAYALGTNMADSIIQINNDFKSMGLDINVVKRGFDARVQEKSELNDDQVNEQLQIFQQKMRMAQQQKMQEERTARVEENKAFFEKTEKDGFTKTESGLYYKVIQKAKEGAVKPAATDTVRVHYTGKFTNGEEFDSSVGKEPFKFSLKGGVIQGWIEGVKLMDVGSKFQFVIPPELGYGERDRGRIPGNSILVFDVELLEIVDVKKEEEARKAEQAKKAAEAKKAEK
ncbi:FKBP-type peptidyl-prolyl cis-trans isomerase [Aliikangiella sp. IMCC44359]|uniref:FKBP-type peptidyl-prolyl cis-trans isomerase n=1 Tax=Aliikangiella sp. IMCC44359 TaxID=3459125 RepID=UPI00403AD4D2